MIDLEAEKAKFKEILDNMTIEEFDNTLERNGMVVKDNNDED